MSVNISNLFRALPAFKGKRRLGRILLNKVINGGRDIKVSGKFGCHYILPNLHEILAFDILIDGIYEKETHDFLMTAIPQNAVVLDIGANIGSISIPLAKRRKDIKVICIEASPFVFDYLSRNVKLNGLESQMICVNKAVAAEEGSLPFYSAPENFGKGSLSPVFTTDAVMVEAVTVDHLLQSLNIMQVDFVKADIEGFEYFAFAGSQEMLSKDSPPILFEFVDWAEEHSGCRPGAAQEFLVQHGYDLFILQKNKQLRELDTNSNIRSAMLYAVKKINDVSGGHK